MIAQYKLFWCIWTSVLLLNSIDRQRKKINGVGGVSDSILYPPFDLPYSHLPSLPQKKQNNTNYTPSLILPSFCQVYRLCSVEGIVVLIVLSHPEESYIYTISTLQKKLFFLSSDSPSHLVHILSLLLTNSFKLLSKLFPLPSL